LYQTYQDNKDKYAAIGHAPPIHYDETQHSADGTPLVVAIPYKDPSKQVILPEPGKVSFVFKNVDGMPVVSEMRNKETNTIVMKANANGQFDDKDIKAALDNGILSRSSATIVFGEDNVTKVLNPEISTTKVFPANYTQDDWDADKASGKIPKDATFASYDPKTGQIKYNTPSNSDDNSPNYQCPYTQRQRRYELYCRTWRGCPGSRRC
jgi:hypothetical protein